LNIGSGGKRHLAAQLKNKTVVDLDIAGDVDYLINLEVDPLKFQNNEFDIVVALDVLEHLDNFHEIVNKSIEIASKSVIISLPNPLNEVLNIVKNKKYNGTDENGLYSKYYGLPRKKPRDRHKWWFTIDSVVNFFEQYNKDYNLRYAVVYIDTIKRRVAKILIGENRFYRFYTSGIWVIIDKKSCPSGKV
nr:hypothetical protein [Paludibacter sp.]